MHSQFYSTFHIIFDRSRYTFKESKMVEAPRTGNPRFSFLFCFFSSWCVMRYADMKIWEYNVERVYHVKHVDGPAFEQIAFVLSSKRNFVFSLRGVRDSWSRFFVDRLNWNNWTKIMYFLYYFGASLLAISSIFLLFYTKFWFRIWNRKVAIQFSREKLTNSQFVIYENLIRIWW